MYSNDSKFKKSSSVYLGKTVTEYNIYNPSKAAFYVKIYSYKNYKGKKYYSPAAKTVTVTCDMAYTAPAKDEIRILLQKLEKLFCFFLLVLFLIFPISFT